MNINRVEKLKANEGCWETAMGAWFPGERVVFQGKDVFSELSELSFSQMLFYGVSGKIFEDNVLEFMRSASSVCTSYPDPRLWNNRVAALGGTTRSTAALSLAAANAVSEATTFGGSAMKGASDFILRALKKTKKEQSVEEIVEYELREFRSLPGFGRPITRVDERIIPMLNKAEALGLKQGEHLKLAFEVENYLIEKRRRLNLNVNGVFAAMMADLGATADEYNQFFLLSFSAGAIACYKDAVNHEEGAFFPFSIEKINYKGESKRSW